MCWEVVQLIIENFFKPALNILKNTEFDVIHDLGCGDGNFLKNINSKFKSKKLSGSDLSKVSIIETKKNLGPKNVSLIKSNALDIKKWVSWLIKKYNPKKTNNFNQHVVYSA